MVDPASRPQSSQKGLPTHTLSHLSLGPGQWLTYDGGGSGLVGVVSPIVPFSSKTAEGTFLYHLEMLSLSCDIGDNFKQQGIGRNHASFLV